MKLAGNSQRRFAFIRIDPRHPRSNNGTRIHANPPGRGQVAADLREFFPKSIAIICCMVLFVNLPAQDKERSWRLNGHLQMLQDLWIPPSTSQWQTMTMVGNRFDFRWTPGDVFSMHAGLRNNLNLGQMVQLYYPYYAEMSTREDGFLDLTKLWVSDSSYYFYSNIDRLNFKVRAGKFEATVGRQRINWGINMVWTPNDIFNSFNYFDFDYVERPGCDAVLLEYFTGTASSLQLGFKIDDRERITSALMYRYNRWNYDFQFFCGIMTEDLVAGAGWSGDIKGAGFTGEMSYFHPYDNFADSTGIFECSLSLNYTFKNSIFVNGSYLFNSAGTKGPAGYGTVLALYADISAKNFTRAKHSVFADIGYPFTPLIRTDLACIVNPNDKSGFIGPSVDISLTGNVSLFMIGQLFWGGDMTEFGDYGSLCYLRLKWSF
jgi:hypothetical protein